MKRNSSENSNHEMMADLSLSTLGMLMIFMCMYVFFFNSRGALNQVIQLKNELDSKQSQLSDLEAQNDQLKIKASSLEEDLSEMVSEIERSRKNLQESNQKLEKSEQQLAAVKEITKLSGRYSGRTEETMYFGGCYGSNYRTYSVNVSVDFMSSVEEMIISSSSEYGMQTVRLKGDLDGNIFTIRKVERSDFEDRSIESCGSSSSLIGTQIMVYEGYIMYDGDRFRREQM